MSLAEMAEAFVPEEEREGLLNEDGEDVCRVCHSPLVKPDELRYGACRSCQQWLAEPNFDYEHYDARED